MDSLGQRIRQLRGTRSQNTYAAQLGISKGSLGAYERDASTPDADTLSAICLLEDVSCDWLLLGKGDRQGIFPPSTPVAGEGRLGDIERRLVFVEELLHSLLRAHNKQ